MRAVAAAVAALFTAGCMPAEVTERQKAYDELVAGMEPIRFCSDRNFVWRAKDGSLWSGPPNTIYTRTRIAEGVNPEDFCDAR